MELSGDCIPAAINFPGSWHDSKIATTSGLYTPRLTDYTPRGYALLAESAFSRHAPLMEGKIVRACKLNEYRSLEDIVQKTHTWLRFIQCVSVQCHQSAKAQSGAYVLSKDFKRLTVLLSATFIFVLALFLSALICSIFVPAVYV